MFAHKIEVEVKGLLPSHTDKGTYGLMLEEVAGNRTLVVIIGTPEAQAIAFEMQGISPARPLPHDLFRPLFTQLNIRLHEVFVHRYHEGVFYALLRVEQFGNVFEIDARTSDAVAIALRLKAPIFVREEIAQKMAMVMVEDEDDIPETLAEQLQRKLNEALEAEDYERASQLRDQLAQLPPNNPHSQQD